ncbi:unnamed protein product [Effrenium voratum]|uniref:Uncharacterized protein n=1 Tax=Effrenium voratum TaxID=2562239 RepID=A0AA36HS99_9DINO|nr:unnamed protein product [Effrenium voratum]CAJ1426221.1 unnamed protein product [Effrenium voratum]
MTLGHLPVQVVCTVEGGFRLDEDAEGPMMSTSLKMHIKIPVPELVHALARWQGARESNLNSQERQAAREWSTAQEAAQEWPTAQEAAQEWSAQEWQAVTGNTKVQDGSWITDPDALMQRSTALLEELMMQQDARPAAEEFPDQAELECAEDNVFWAEQLGSPQSVRCPKPGPSQLRRWAEDSWNVGFYEAEGGMTLMEELSIQVLALQDRNGRNDTTEAPMADEEADVSDVNKAAPTLQSWRRLRRSVATSLMQHGIRAAMPAWQKTSKMKPQRLWEPLPGVQCSKVECTENNVFWAEQLGSPQSLRCPKPSPSQFRRWAEDSWNVGCYEAEGGMTLMEELSIQVLALQDKNGRNDMTEASLAEEEADVSDVNKVEPALQRWRCLRRRVNLQEWQMRRWDRTGGLQ